MNKPPKIQTDKTIEGREVEDFFRTKVGEVMRRAAGQPDKKRFIIDEIAASKEKWFQGREELFENIVEKVEALQYATDAEFEEKLAKELTDTVEESIKAAGLSMEEVRRKFRLMRIEQDGHTPLDKRGVLYCSKHEGTVELHITEGLTPGVWKEAMAKFLHYVEADESIRVIKMKSWVVAEKVPFFENKGFTVQVLDEERDKEELQRIRENLDEGMEENRGKPIAEARMSREKFLERQWAKTKEE